ncbi:MAG: hypothetical protein AB1489_22840 [Acidobacteriota bacterium]
MKKRTFQARVIDLDEEIECSIDEVSTEDRPLIKPGALFTRLMNKYINVSTFRDIDSVVNSRQIQKRQTDE